MVGNGHNYKVVWRCGGVAAWRRGVRLYICNVTPLQEHYISMCVSHGDENSLKSVLCSTDPEMIIIMCPNYSITLTTKVTLKYLFIATCHDIMKWETKCLNINLYLFYYFLFILFSNLPSWIMRQGHQESLCVFCLQSASRLFCDEVVVYKSVTPGSGPEPRQWSIINMLLRLRVWNEEVLGTCIFLNWRWGTASVTCCPFWSCCWCLWLHISSLCRCVLH